MTVTVNRAAVRIRLAATLRDHAAIGDAIGQPALPDDLARWLGRLMLLAGVPYPYLVPDERMLPDESIRFFRLDLNWIAALVDGAFSIGRNLTNSAATVSMAMDRASAPSAVAHAQAGARGLRAAALGVAPPAAAPSPAVSGFLLRSRVVGAYPGLGVNAYGPGAGSGAPPTTPLSLLRLEQLGAGSNVLLCLIAGDAARIDIHEAPEHLHYGLDRYGYDAATNKVTAWKNIYPFTDTDPVTIAKTSKTIDLGGCFRPTSPRTMRIAATASAVGAANSAQMGFVMTEGVGLVSFLRRTP
jgi:hypothetical protein